MYSKGIEIPKVSFSALDYNEIEPGSFFIGFNLDLGGKLCKIDSNGTLTVIEGAGGGGSVISVSDDGQGIVEVYNVDPTNPIVKFNGVETDGVTVTGDGTVLNPLTASIVDSVDVTHSELVTLKSTGTLKPGMNYRITDFQTIYDQPDFNLNGTPKTNPTVKTGPVEPIIVAAMSTDELGLDAFQEDHPNDIIQYILEFTTPVTNTPTKGRIIKRIDDRGNESDFDHRNVLFKRYLDRNDSYSKYEDTIGGLIYDEFTKVQSVMPEKCLGTTKYGLNVTSTINGANPGRYINLPQSGVASISGATGLEFNVNVSQSGSISEIEMIAEVYGYVPGDVVDIDVTQIGGSGTLSITLQDNNFRIFQVDIDSSVNVTTSGNGQGAELRLYYDLLGLQVTVYEPGSGYEIGDTITIPASAFADLPGQPATDLILTVTRVITDFTESLAVDPTKDFENYLGDTYSHYLNSEIVGYQPAFDLPNIIIGKDSYANNNRFYGYLRNINVPGRCRNSSFLGGTVNFGSSYLMIENTIISGKISDFHIRGSIFNSNLGTVSDIKISGDASINNSTINKFIGFKIRELIIGHSTINDFRDNQINIELGFGWRGRIIFDEARLTINLCQFNQFTGNIFHGRDSYLASNNIHEFTGNNIGDGIEYVGFTFNDFDRFENCTIIKPNNGRNRGHVLSNCVLGGHVANNDFGPYTTDCIFGYGFGYDDWPDEFESISHDYINSTGGNVFRSSVADCTFGRYSTGNVFNTSVTRVIFRDHLTNNCFDNLINSSDNSQPYVTLDGPSELYERQKTRVFIHRRPHEYTYSIGDKYMLGNFPQGGGSESYLYWYRSDNASGLTTNLFFSTELFYIGCAWQIEPAFLGTQSGLNMSKLNTTLISEDPTPQVQVDTFIGDLMNIINRGGSHDSGITRYIPSLAELQEIYDNYSAIGPTYYDSQVGTVPIIYTGKVWSSTEADANNAYAIDFSTGTTSIEPKTERHPVILIGVKTYDYVLKLEYVDEYGSTTIIDLN